MHKKKVIILVFVIAISFIFLLIQIHKYSTEIKLLNERLLLSDNSINEFSKNGIILFDFESLSRDFYRYKCENRKRIGGYSHYIQAVPHDLYRVEGNFLNPFKDY